MFRFSPPPPLRLITISMPLPLSLDYRFSSPLFLRYAWPSLHFDFRMFSIIAMPFISLASPPISMLSL
jgi:hypothetical protein